MPDYLNLTLVRHPTKRVEFLDHRQFYIHKLHLAELFRTGRKFPEFWIEKRPDGKWWFWRGSWDEEWNDAFAGLGWEKDGRPGCARCGLIELIRTPYSLDQHKQIVLVDVEFRRRPWKPGEPCPSCTGRTSGPKFCGVCGKALPQ